MLENKQTESTNTIPEATSTPTPATNVVTTPIVEPTDKKTKPFGSRNAKDGKGGFNKRNTRSRVDAMGFEEKVVSIKRISKTTKGGRHMRFSALVVMGDKTGKVGYGIGKSTEVPAAIKKAMKNARNNVTKVIMNKRNTIYHEIIGRHGASRVLLKPAPQGTGIIAGGAIRAVIELAGFKDIYTKNLGSNTSLNMVQATLNGLINQRHPSVIAKLRDKELANL
jgi:small subunit ribosomal protein S5